MSYDCSILRKFWALIVAGEPLPFDMAVMFAATDRVPNSLWRRCSDPSLLGHLAMRAQPHNSGRRSLRLAMVDYVARTLGDTQFPWALLRRARRSPESDSPEIADEILALRRALPSPTDDLLFLFWGALRGNAQDDVFFPARCVEVLRTYALHRAGMQRGEDDDSGSYAERHRYERAFNAANNAASEGLARWLRRNVPPPKIGDLFYRGA